MKLIGFDTRSSQWEFRLLKLGQNKNGQKNFCFSNTFLQLAAEKKYSKNSAAGKIFGPSYFVTALAWTFHNFISTQDEWK